MRHSHTDRIVLVPIFGDDVSDESFSVAAGLLARPGARLVLVHVVPADADGSTCIVTRRESRSSERRWRRLAAVAGPNRTFVEAVLGDPATEVLAEAERFHSDAIVVGPAVHPRLSDAWIDRAIAQIARAAPRRVRIANRCEARQRARLTSHTAPDGRHRRRIRGPRPSVSRTPVAVHDERRSAG